jgi:hypothetical protein
MEMQAFSLLNQSAVGKLASYQGRTHIHDMVLYDTNDFG